MLMRAYNLMAKNKQKLKHYIGPTKHDDKLQ